MLHYGSLDELSLAGAWLTIGALDGVHRGHQAIVRRLVEGAHQAGAPAVALTFFPHPALVLGKTQDPFYLTSPDERAALLGDLGVDIVITQPFNLELAHTSAEDFIIRIQRHLGITRLLEGPDFALGRGREGNIARLQELGQAYGFTLEVLEPVRVGDQVVSSSLIRTALAEGDVIAAGLLLGRPFRLQGPIVTGDQRGRQLGIPTANLQIWPGHAIPKAGVYCCTTEVGGHTLGAVTNIGVRPTFETQPVAPRVETHILDFNRDLYGENLALDFHTRLRNEQRFPNVEALVAQIQADIARAREILQELHLVP